MALAVEMQPKIGALLQRTFAALDEEGVVWCLLRGESALGGCPNDIDLLVAREDLRKAERALAPLGFVPVPKRSRHHAFLAYDEERDGWLVLDVVCELAFGQGAPLRLRGVRDALANRERRGAIPLLTTDDRFFALLLHHLLDRGEISAASRRSLQRLAECADGTGPLARSLDAGRVPETDPARLIGLVRAGDWESLLRVADGLRPQRTGWRRRMRMMVRSPVRSMRRLSVLARRRPGMTVAILGPDGAGKSTLAAGLLEVWPLPGRLIYMGMQPGRSVPGATWQAPVERVARGRGPLHRRLLRQVRRLIRFVWRSLQARVHARLGRLVLFDRYTYDAEVNWERKSGLAARVRLELVRRAAAPPDIVVLIDVPGRTMFERKGEHTVELLEKRRRRYLELADRLPRVVVVDGTDPPERVRRAATAALWRAYTTHEAKAGRHSPPLRLRWGKP